MNTRQWVGSCLLGLWLSVATVWPVSFVSVRLTQIMWQPLLLASLTILTVVRRRRFGWRGTLGHSLWIYAILNVAAWLPSLRATGYEYPYPRAYGYYLAAYEGVLAALIGYQALYALVSRAP